MKSLLILLAILVGSQPQDHIEVVAEMTPDYAAGYLEVACEYTGGICPVTPTVYFTPTRAGLWGYHYRGSDLVFITDRCLTDTADHDKCAAVVVHEMVHYIVSEQNRMKDSCVNEQFAWAIYNQYVFGIDRADLYNDNWRRGYPRCQITYSE